MSISRALRLNRLLDELDRRPDRTARTSELAAAIGISVEDVFATLWLDVRCADTRLTMLGTGRPADICWRARDPLHDALMAMARLGRRVKIREIEAETCRPIRRLRGHLIDECRSRNPRVERYYLEEAHGRVERFELTEYGRRWVAEQKPESAASD